MGDGLTTSQWTLLSSAVIYPLAFYISMPDNVTPARFARSREAISVFHCSLVTVLSILCLRQSSAGTLLSSGSTAGPPITGLQSPLPESDTDLPIITHRSEFANSITALETGYLLQDSLILFWADRLHRHARARGFKPLKGLNIRHIAWHHGFPVCGLGVLQWYIARGKEKGILIIIMMFLMNASSPIGTVRWYLVNFRPGYHRAIMAATVAYLAMYGVSRVYLIYYILQIFGAQRGHSAMQAFARLRTPCQLGTGAIGVVNSTWLIMGISRFLTRDLRFGTGARKKK
jgi:TLC domain